MAAAGGAYFSVDGEHVGMTLDVTVPDPPALRGPQPRGEYDGIDSPSETDDDFRREEVATILAAGAWHDAFEEWASQTSLVEAEFDLVREHDLIDDFDFYWDPASDEVGYRAPTLPNAVTVEHARRDDDIDPGEVDNELDTLGRVVSEMLENDYLLRDEETFGFFSDTGEEREFDPDDRHDRSEENAVPGAEEPLGSESPAETDVGDTDDVTDDSDPGNTR